MPRKNPCIPLLLLLVLSACGPSGGEHGGHGAFGMRHLAAPLMHHALRMGMGMAMRGQRPRGFRRACEEDAAKLCPGLARRQQRDCLQGKQAMLSSECREALDRRLEHMNGRGNEHTN